MRSRAVKAALALPLILVCSACGGGGGGSGGGNESLQRTDPPSGVALTWRGGAEAAGYIVHWGTASHVYTSSLDVGDPPPAADGSVTFVVELDPTDTYYFAVTSYSAAGLESAFSNELSLRLR
jgi:hypothetical protein